MALRFIDSFNHYSTGQLADKWTSTSGGVTIVAQSRWAGQNAAQFGDLDILDKVFPVGTGHATWILGAAIYPIQYPQASTQGIFQLLEGGTLHSELRIQDDGRLFAMRNGTSLGSGSILTLGRWHYVEIFVTVHDTTGLFIVKIDGVTDINLSNQDTRNGGTGVVDTVRLRGGLGSNWAWWCNDFYACDGSGGAPTNTFLGDCRVECLFPNGNGNSSVLVGSDANSVDNYLLVDETSPNDADYVESSAPGDKDTYTYTNLATTSGTVFGVQPVPRALKTDAGSRSIVSVARLSGTETDSAAKTLGSTVDYLEDVRETKPGGGAWTISDVNSSEFGVKINA